MNTGQPENKRKRLTDEELARLLSDKLDPSERASLLERLENEPESARILALAAGELPPGTGGFSKDTIDRLLATIRENTGVSNICPHCAGDLHPGGIFCPHCAARTVGNAVTCIKCRKPVREDSRYCPHCGSFFRPIERKSMIETSLYLLILGLASLVLSVVTASFSTMAFIIFLAIGCVSLGAWFGERIVLWRRTTGIQSDTVEEKEPEDETRERKSG